MTMQQDLQELLDAGKRIAICVKLDLRIFEPGHQLAEEDFR